MAKDITIVEKDLANVFLVDNLPSSFVFCKENGIPIEEWRGFGHDEALLELLPFLDALRYTDDVRSVLGLRYLK